MPLLTQATTLKLISRAQRGDSGALNTLVQRNMGLVYAQANRYPKGKLPAWITEDDLIAEGMLGLVRAIEKFDPRREARLSTYAVYWIRQRMGRFVDENSFHANVPCWCARLRKKLYKLSAHHTTQHGSSPSTEELARLAKEPLARVKRALAVPLAAYSLDEDNAGGVTYGELLADDSDHYSDAEDAHHLATAWKAIANAMAHLTTEEQRVLQLHYALTSRGALKLREIGHRLGKSGEWVRQIRNRALEKLRGALVTQ